MRQRLADLKQALREMFSPTWSHDDDPPNLEADIAARTAFIQKMRHPEGGDSA